MARQAETGNISCSMDLIFKKVVTARLANVLAAWGELDEKAINFSEGFTLEGLTLKKRDLPGVGLRVKGGFIKQLSIKVPWKRLKKESVRVEINELFVILGPRAMTGTAHNSRMCLCCLQC